MTSINNNQTSLSQNKLLLLSFVEGACVMIAELGGGKMLAPFFGTSLYVWASTMAITLGALTIGYYIGGELSKRPIEKRKKALFITIAIASALVIAMPLWAKTIMKATIFMNLIAGVVLSQLLFLLPPILGMGIVSPMIISMIAENNNSGKAAGLVYAISTFGGVLATLLVGFWLVPVLGISIPCMVIGAILFLLNILFLKPKRNVAVASVLVLLIPVVYFLTKPSAGDTEKYKLLYHSEGMLGQVKVVDFKYNIQNKPLNTRCMMVNHNWQTWVNNDDKKFSFIYYTRFTDAVIRSLPKNSKALLIGLGGGTVALELEENNVDYDAVEIDGRLPELAEKYFGLSSAIENTTIDDGRHFVNVCKEKYDLIIIDALLGDNIPSHLLSIECFSQMKALLKDNGKVFIEFDGIVPGSEGVAQQLLLNTLEKAGYTAHTYTTLPNRTEFDVMYVASPGGETASYDTLLIEDVLFPTVEPVKNYEVSLSRTTTAYITDDNPVLDFYLRDRMVAFRQENLEEYNLEMLEDGLPFYR